MRKNLKIALIIADEHEYIPVEKLALSSGGKPIDVHGYNGHNWSINKNGLSIEVSSLLVGIGKVNAATGASLLIASGADIVFNTGLSGGISGVKKGDLAIGTKFLEHDFDLTVLGYKIAEKPRQKYFYDTDSAILSIFKLLNIDGLKYGTMVCGDSFISTESKRSQFEQEFNAIACDMESAAIASCCYKAGIPFGCVRIISDDANEDAVEQYEELNNKDLPISLSLTMMAIEKIFEINEFWQ